MSTIHDCKQIEKLEAMCNKINELDKQVGIAQTEIRGIKDNIEEMKNDIKTLSNELKTGNVRLLISIISSGLILLVSLIASMIIK
jgi:archaellum component FlaC